MLYDKLSWIFIALIVVGVVGLIATIVAHINRSISKPALTSLRVAFIALAIIGAAGLGALILGVFPGGPPPHAAGVNATANGVLTNGQNNPTSTQ